MTASTGGTSTTSPPPPACRSDSDCEGDCTYCEDGECVYEPGCCGYGLQGWRCLPAECYVDEDCPRGEACIDLKCFEVEIPIPLCPPPPLDPGSWNLELAPSSFALADLDDDGDLDLAAGVATVGRIDLAFNDGAGGFVVGASALVGEPASDLDVVAGEFNADGMVDLVVSRAAPGELTLLLGQGGVFVPGAVIATDATIGALFVGRIDGGTQDDVLAIDAVSGDFTVWLGDGMGGLLPGELFDAGDPVGTGAALFDVEGDGFADLVALTEPPTGEILVFDSDMGGNFVGIMGTGGVPMTATHAHAGQLAADVDAELVATWDDGVAGGGAAVFGVGPWGPPFVYFTQSRLSGGALGDFDGDGRLDLVSASNDAAVVVLLGDGQAGFTCELVVPIGGGPPAPEVLAVGDVNADGKADVVAGSRTDTAVTVLIAP